MLKMRQYTLSASAFCFKALAIAALAFIIAASPRRALARDIAVIVNKNVDEADFTKSKLQDIYSLNKRYWSDGTKIQVVDIKGESETKNKFYQLLGMPFDKVQKMWIRKLFSGKALPPKTFSDEKEVLEHVAKTPGAIGYVSSDKVDDSVKKIE